MECKLTHQEIKEFLTILDSKIAHAQDFANKNSQSESESKRLMAAMHSGMAIGYATARDILFSLDQILDRKEDSGYYNTANLPKFTLDYFKENFDK